MRGLSGWLGVVCAGGQNLGIQKKKSPWEKFMQVDHNRKKTCLLPGCEIIVHHNGGYCCADHCRKHRGEQITQERGQ